MTKYQVIYADPPWRFSQGISARKTFNSLHKEELNKHYITMKDEEIINLGIGNLADSNAVLFLWTTDAHLEIAMKAINQWGFKYKTIAFVWNKIRPSMGKWNVKQCEVCLLATKGTPHKMLKSFKERQYLEFNKGKHSQKPQEIRERIERMLPNTKKIELFARENPPNWEVWGNEVRGDIKL